MANAGAFCTLTLLCISSLSWGLEQGLDGFIKQEVIDKLTDFDRVVQGNAFQSFKHPRTGVIIDVSLNITQTTAQAVRLRTGSLRRRGFSFNEFTIPTGGSPQSISPTRLLLVYRKFTANLYKPVNYTLISPVVGIKVYDAFNLSATDAVPELDYVFTGSSNLTVKIPLPDSVAGLTPQCAAFDKAGNVSIFELRGSECSWNRLGDFALVIPGTAAVPAPAPSPTAATAPGSARRRKKRSNRWKIVLGAVLGGIAAILLLLLVIFALVRCCRGSRIKGMQQRSDRGEMLQTSLIGGSRAPTAGASRTKPVLESDYAA